MRVRLIGRRGLPYRVATVVVSLLIGLTVAAFAARMVFLAADNTPEQAMALAVADEATGLARADEGRFAANIDIAHVDWMGKGQEPPPRHEGWPGRTPSPGPILAFYRAEGDPLDLLTSTRTRLSERGWEVGPRAQRYGTGGGRSARGSCRPRPSTRCWRSPSSSTAHSA